ncbi:Membrane protein insertase YidC [Streptomyces griseomycini]
MDTIASLFSFITTPVSWVIVQFHKVYGAIFGPDTGWAWGLSIVSLVILIRICLIPLFVKQIKATRAMQTLQPEMKKIQERYKNDRQRQSEEMMKLYKETGTNPLSSCLPILAQSPVLSSGVPERSHARRRCQEGQRQARRQYPQQGPVRAAQGSAAAQVPVQEVRRSPSVTEGTTSAAAEGADTLTRLEQEGEIAADYLEGLLDIADLDGDIDMDVEADRASVSIISDTGSRDLQKLVGRDGEVLEALQELTRLAVHRETGDRSRLMLDIAGYRAKKRTELSELGAKAAAEAKSSGEPVKLDPMTPFERKVVHDAVKAAGLRSESEGEEPQRFVVVLPA